jgi:transmembrane sensor
MDEQRQDAAPALLPVRKAVWSAEHSRHALSNVRARVDRRARLERRTVAALAVAACVLGLLSFARVWPEDEQAQREQAQDAQPTVAVSRPAASSKPSSGAPQNRSLSFADGSHVVLLDERTRVEVERADRESVEVALLEGQGRFTVVSQPGRAFVVHVEKFAIVTLAAAFTVTREPERVHVRVLEGEVEVNGAAQQQRLHADDALWFNLTPASRTDAAPTESGVSRADPKEAARRRFLDHARHRQYARAMAVLREKPSVVRDNPEELMLAADAARLSGDAPAAVPYLKRVAANHPKDARAPLAAFTLGRIYLFDLNQPLQAREAFALTRRLSSQGALAEDALAREVEAAARTGAQREAQALAQEYLSRYPQGRRRAQIRSFAEPR